MSETPAIAPKSDRIPVETRMANTNEAVKAMLAAEAAARAEDEAAACPTPSSGRLNQN